MAVRLEDLVERDSVVVGEPVGRRHLRVASAPRASENLDVIYVSFLRVTKALRGASRLTKAKEPKQSRIRSPLPTANES